MSQRETGHVKWFNEKKDLVLLLIKKAKIFSCITKTFRELVLKRCMKMIQLPLNLIEDLRV